MLNLLFSGLLAISCAMAQSDPTLESVTSDLALASNILAQQGVVDAFGHVSARHPTNASQFLLSRNLAPAQVTPGDILVYNVADASPVDPNAPAGFIERFIHSELYKRFDAADVGAVVHFHAPQVIPFGVSARLPFLAISHVGGFIGATPAPVFDIAQKFGRATDLLVRNETIGAALAEKFGDPNNASAQRAVVLMRGHGATLTASTVRLAVFRAVYTKVTAEELSALASMGALQGAEFLSPAEANATAVTLAGQADRAFNVWQAQVNGSVPAIMPV